MRQLSFTPHPEAVYDYDYEKIVGELNELVDKPERFLHFARFWCKESLFFLLYFVLRVPVNHPWLVERVKEVQNCNDRTLDLWFREGFKALATDTKVLTIHGWKSHGDLQPGDQIFGSQGQVVTVVANTGPMEGADCYKIIFDDGEIIASAEHMWPVLRKIHRRVPGSNQRHIEHVQEIVRTDELPVTSDNNWKYKLLRTPVINFPRQTLPLPLNSYLQRKLTRCKEGSPYNDGRYIRAIEKVESVPVNCIQVDALDGIYLAGYSLVPTHNSSIITYGLNIQEILRNPNITIGIFSHTRAIAKSFLRRIRITFESNDFLKSLFPDILYQNPAYQSPKWNEDEGLIVKRQSVLQECTLEAWGITDGMPVSKHFGVLHYDDIVTREGVSTPAQIAKVEECFRLSLNLGTVDGGKVRVIGTHYHFNDQYSKLKSQGGWKVRQYPAEDENGNSVLLDPAVLAQKRRDYGPYVYSCQMLLSPVAKEEQKFKYEWLRFYRKLPSPLALYLLCDPANAKKQRTSGSDYTVYWLWGIDTTGNKFLVDAIRDRLTLPERWRALKMMVSKHPRIQRIGYEQYGMTADVQHFFEMMREEAFYFSIVELGGNKLSKEDRIARLIPEFEQHKIWLPEHLEYEDKDGNVVDLVKVFIDEEYLTFPFSKHDDMLDAASRIEDEAFGAFPPYDESEPLYEYDSAVGWGGPELVGRCPVTGY